MNGRGRIAALLMTSIHIIGANDFSKLFRVVKF